MASHSGDDSTSHSGDEKCDRDRSRSRSNSSANNVFVFENDRIADVALAMELMAPMRFRQRLQAGL